MSVDVRNPLRPLRLLAVVSIALPLLLIGLIGLIGAYRLKAASVEAEQRVSRSLRVAHEHASRVLAGSEALQDRIYDLVQGRSLADLRANEASLHALLKSAIKDQPQIQSIWVIGADGVAVASSERSPVPPIDVRDRTDFHIGTATATTRFVSEPTVSGTGEVNRKIKRYVYVPPGTGSPALG